MSEDNITILKIIGFGIVGVAILVAIWLVINYPAPNIPIAHGLWEKEQAIRDMQHIIDLVRQYIERQEQYFNDHEAYGQNATPPKPVTSPPNPTPTTPTPNLQYLPQKAYIIPFAPENGIPQSTPLASPLATGPVQPVQTVPVQPVAPVQNQSLNGLDIMGILGALAGGVATVKSYLVGKKTNNNEGLVKDTMAAEGKTKDQVGELARLLFEWNKEKSEALDGTAPKVKLETLKQDKEEFADKTAKS